MSDRHLHIVDNTPPPHPIEARILDDETAELDSLAKTVHFTDLALEFLNATNLEEKSLLGGHLERVKRYLEPTIESQLTVLNHHYQPFLGNSIAVGGEGEFWQDLQNQVTHWNYGDSINVFDFSGVFDGFIIHQNKSVCLVVVNGPLRCYFPPSSLNEVTVQA